MKAQRITISLVLLFVSIQYGTCQGNLKNKDVARRYFEEVVNKQRLDLLHEIFADSFVVHILVDNKKNYGTITTQRDFLTYLFKAFPDIHYTIGDIIEEEDKVAMRVNFSATHKDEFWGYEASGNHVNYLSEIFFFRFENGKVKESWVQFDLYNLFKELE